MRYRLMLYHPRAADGVPPASASASRGYVNRALLAHLVPFTPLMRG
jgi:hypothetical protein